MRWVKENIYIYIQIIYIYDIVYVDIAAGANT